MSSDGPGRPQQFAPGIEEHAAGRCDPSFCPAVGAADAELGLIPAVTGRIMGRAVALVHPIAVVGMDQGGEQLGIGWGRASIPMTARNSRTNGASL